VYSAKRIAFNGKLRHSTGQLRRSLYFLIALFITFPHVVAGQSPSKPRSNTALEDALQVMFGVESFSHATISPDGKNVA
jgi:hypothetical protein